MCLEIAQGSTNCPNSCSTTEKENEFDLKPSSLLDFPTAMAS